MSKKNPKPRFEYGDPCPPIAAMFFPYDPSAKPHKIEDKEEKKDEQADPAQPS